MVHQVEIPESFLVTLSVYGNMGDGDLPKVMQLWAERECARLGLTDKVKTERENRYQELKRRVTNIMGSDTVDRLERFSAALAKATNSGRSEGGHHDE